MLTLSLCLALLAPQGPSVQVVLNEISYEDSGTDDREFVELFNPGTRPIDIGNWLVDSANASGPQSAYTVPAGTMLAAGDYYVLGSALVPNVDQVVGTTDLWVTGPATITLRVSGGAVIDTVGYGTHGGLWPGALFEGEGLWGDFISVDGTETSWSRVRDGGDSNNNGYDFALLPSTPGAPNALMNTCVAISENYDSAAPETAVSTWGASFHALHVVDPTMASTHNPAAIVASPQGGNCAAIWDPAGEATADMMLTDVPGPAAFEALVYLDASRQQTGESQSWSIGFGSTDSGFALPDPDQKFQSNANGNTGISWTFVVHDTGADLFLIDHNDGGWTGAVTPWTELGRFAIRAGVNDGWQRLRLEISGGIVIGTFGGTLGGTGGEQRTAVTPWSLPTTLYAAFREGVADQAKVRPLMIDALALTPLGAASVTPYGTASATTVGTPAMVAMGLPTIGNAAFSFDLSGLVPNQMTTVFIGVAALPRIDLGRIGGPPGSALYVNPALALELTLPVDPAGKSKLAVPVPCNPFFAGQAVTWQIVDFDPGLQFPIQVGTSQPVTTLFGY